VFREKLLVGIIIVLALAIGVAGCVTVVQQPAAEPQAPAAEESEAEPADSEAEMAEDTMKVAMILPGPIGDQGWNTKAYLALEEYEGQGFETAYTDEVPTPDNESFLRSYAEQGSDLIVGHGFTFVDQALKVAPEFPDSHFFITAGLPPEDADLPSNVNFMQYKSEQGFYLAGMLAGLMTESDKIGYVGAQATPICLADLAAYKLGAREVNPDVEILTVWVGAWEDPAKGREAAIAQIDNGADVIIHDADLTGTGALRAGKEKGVYLIGVIDDQSDIAPELFLTSVKVDVTEAIASQVELIKSGEFGGVWSPGMADEIVGLTPFGPAVPEEVAEQIKARAQEIIDGSFEVPSIYEEIE
jgi:basic membrane protein A